MLDTDVASASVMVSLPWHSARLALAEENDNDMVVNEEEADPDMSALAERLFGNEDEEKNNYVMDEIGDDNDLPEATASLVAFHDTPATQHQYCCFRLLFSIARHCQTAVFPTKFLWLETV